MAAPLLERTLARGEATVETRYRPPLADPRCAALLAQGHRQGLHSLSAVDAYMLSSVCGDLKISEIVDLPNWVVSFYFPRIVFE